MQNCCTGGRDRPIPRKTGMGMKKKITTAIPMFVESTTTKKMVLKKIITGNKGAKGPTVMETDERMQEI
jgi:hypothetical protein